MDGQENGEKYQSDEFSFGISEFEVSVRHLSRDVR